MHLIWCTFSTASLGTTSVWPGTYVYTIVNTRSIRTPVTILNVAGICTCGNLSRKAMTFSSSYTICTKPQVRVSLTCSSWLKTWYPLLFTFDSKGLQQWAATAHSTQLEAMNERSLTCSAKLPGFLVMSIVNSDSAMLRSVRGYKRHFACNRERGERQEVSDSKGIFRTIRIQYEPYVWESVLASPTGTRNHKRRRLYTRSLPISHAQTAGKQQSN